MVFDYKYYQNNKEMNLLWDIGGIVVSIIGIISIVRKSWFIMGVYFIGLCALFFHINYFFAKSDIYSKEKVLNDYFFITCFYYMMLEAVMVYELYASFKGVIKLFKDAN